MSLQDLPFYINQCNYINDVFPNLHLIYPYTPLFQTSRSFLSRTILEGDTWVPILPPDLLFSGPWIFPRHPIIVLTLSAAILSLIPYIGSEWENGGSGEVTGCSCMLIQGWGGGEGGGGGTGINWVYMHWELQDELTINSPLDCWISTLNALVSRSIRLCMGLLQCYNLLTIGVKALGSVSPKFRSSFYSTMCTSLGAILPPKCISTNMQPTAYQSENAL